jgi:DNA-directed RNA polymerase specialized sigma24 family protein
MKVLQPRPEPVKALRRRIAEMQERGILELAKEVCSREGALVEELFGESRSLPHRRARQFVWWELKDRGWTYAEIAKLFQRDVESVRAAIKRAASNLGLVSGAGADRRAA